MVVPVPSLIVICGKGRIATSALSYTVHYVATQSLPARVVACPNTDDKGYDTWQASLLRAAAQLGVERVSLQEVETERNLLLVSLEYDRIVRVTRFLSRRLYNIHFSALPQYRGVFTSMWPLLNGESHVGVTLHYMDEGVDTGAIVAQRMIPLASYVTARQGYDLYMDEGFALFREWLPRLVTTQPEAIAQDETRATSYNRASIDLGKVEVDLSQTADRICAFIHAFSFPEYQLPTVRGRAIRSCVSIPGNSTAPPGTALHETAYSTSFATGDGRIVEVIWA